MRDRALLEEIKFPVFARGLCIRGTGKDFGARGWINHPLLIGDVTVEAGDLMPGDEDGVVCGPKVRWLGRAMNVKSAVFNYGFVRGAVYLCV